MSHVRPLADPHTVRDLLGVGEVRDQLTGDAKSMGDYARNIDRGVCDPLNGGDDLQHRCHALGFGGATDRQ